MVILDSLSSGRCVRLLCWCLSGLYLDLKQKYRWFSWFCTSKNKSKHSCYTTFYHLVVNNAIWFEG